VIEEVQDEHEVILATAALVHRRRDGEPLAVRMEIVRMAASQPAASDETCRRPELRLVGTEGIPIDVARAKRRSRR